MLILARRVNEQIVINGDIFITVLEAGRGQVRLGISAPPHVQVYRHELWMEIQAERRDTAAPANPDAAADRGRFVGKPNPLPGDTTPPAS